jgi:hypothetical protein
MFNNPVQDTMHGLPPRLHRARALALLLLAFAPFACGVLSLILGQDANWDLRNYHWYNAYAFLNGRYDGIDLLPSQTPYFYNPLLDVPFYLLATHVPARVAGFVLGFVQGLNFILLFMLAHATLIVPNQRHKVVICAALAALGMLGGGGIALLGTTFGDNLTSLGIFWSAFLVVRHWRTLITEPGWRYLFRAFCYGVPAGLMMGLKLPCVVFCVGLCGALVLTGGPLLRRLTLAFAFGCGVLLGLAVTLGHWAWFLQHQFGNPLFPYFNQIFHSPLAPAASARDTQFVPLNAQDFLFFPFIFAHSPFRTGEIPWRDWRIPILYVLLPLAILLRLTFGRNRGAQDGMADPYAARFLLWTAALSYGVWLVMFCIYRYAVPLEMLAPLLILCAVGMLPLRIPTRGLIAAVILAVISASIQPGNWTRRATWLDGPFVQAGIPPLGDTSNLMLLMAGFEPYAHIAAQFPPAIPVIRIQSNFESPEQNKGINALIAACLAAHAAKGGRFLLLIPPWQHKLAADALGYFHLALASGPCQPVIDRLYNDKMLDLCPVENEQKKGRQ